MGEDIILEAKKITKIYPGTVALDQADFRVRKGQVNVLIGENGAGKSTMMKIVAGVETKTSGGIFIDGKEADYKTPAEAIRHGVGIIYQELNLFPNLSISENMFLTREIKKNRFSVDHKKQNEQAAVFLEKLKLDVSPETLVGTLRVGQQQLVEIAKVLSQNAAIIIMDEPTSALTEAEVATLFTVIAELKKNGVTVIYISHRLEEIMHIGDYVTILRDGKFIDEKKVNEIDIPWIIDRMTGGHKIENLYTRRKMGNEILSVQNLSLKKKAGTGYIVQDVSFSLKSGEILGLYGLLGAGRTELLECLIGARKDYTGLISLNNRTLRSKDVNGRIKDGFALIPEDRKTLGIFTNMIILENMVLSSLARFWKGLFLNEKMEQEAARGVAGNLNIKMSAILDSINSLSGGNQQKVIIGRSLLTNPKVLLMDDPTRGIDVGSKYDVYEICKKLAAEGMGLIFVSSEMQEILSIPDRVLVLSQGKLKGEFTHEEITEEKLVAASAINIAKTEGNSEKQPEAV
ncbi:MAG: sugar ABC transporter ATP-binding protein [Treponema sp.]|jgi:erythritol transport system ATP-binding protein|nr:sugar ABC transporter ATP-binding protein [Treponema sp.]